MQGKISRKHGLGKAASAMHRIKKTVFVTLAILFLIIGAAGVILPILPAIPFLLVASYFLTKGTAQFS